MVYAKASLVQRVRYVLGDSPAIDNITAGYTAAGLTLTVADATLYGKGTILEFASDGDQFLVNSVSGTTVTMLASGLSYDGTTNANHSSGAAFYVNPVFPYIRVVEAINSVIVNEMWPYAWKVVSNTITPVSGTRWYDLATSSTNTVDFIDAIQKDSAGTGVVRYGEGREASSIPIEIQFGLPTAIAASTVGVYFPYFNNYVNTVAVRVRAKLTSGLTSTDYTDLTDGPIVDAIIYGAAARLLENTEAPRITQTDVTMGDATVGPQARLRSAAYFHQRFVEKRKVAQRELEISTPPQPRRR